MKFGLFFFSAEGLKTRKESYDLIFDSARFIDDNNFSSIWTPERHFDKFGGLYPNPAIMASAIAAITKKIHIRSGSTVLPIHNPLEVAENWSMVDNISNGRIGIGIAPGWHPNDFIYDPSSYQNRKEILYERLMIIEKLWAGSEIAINGVNNTIEKVELFPKPVQKKLPIWITSSGNPKTWEKAGTLGTNVLTALLGQQSIDQLADNIKIYKRQLLKNDYDIGNKEITVMLHTFLGRDLENVKSEIHNTFVKYLKAHMEQYKHELLGKSIQVNPFQFSTEDENEIAEFAFKKYFQNQTLLGTKEKCLPLLQKLKEIGVTEVACLIDFGLPNDKIMNSLKILLELKEEFTNES
jgi:natural product biosynthesis luciferase-like monooxygenase protein